MGARVSNKTAEASIPTRRCLSFPDQFPNPHPGLVSCPASSRWSSRAWRPPPHQPPLTPPVITPPQNERPTQTRCQRKKRKSASRTRRNPRIGRCLPTQPPSGSRPRSAAQNARNARNRSLARRPCSTAPSTLTPKTRTPPRLLARCGFTPASRRQFFSHAIYVVDEKTHTPLYARNATPWRPSHRCRSS